MAPYLYSLCVSGYESQHECMNKMERKNKRCLHATTRVHGSAVGHIQNAPSNNNNNNLHSLAPFINPRCFIQSEVITCYDSSAWLCSWTHIDTRSFTEPLTKSLNYYIIFHKPEQIGVFSRQPEESSVGAWTISIGRVPQLQHNAFLV